MGIAISFNRTKRIAAINSMRIDQQLRTEIQINRNIIKLLLLGMMNTIHSFVYFCLFLLDTQALQNAENRPS